ncbi:myogenesis-regulating glycosidase-like [Glandiceps talaboti]
MLKTSILVLGAAAVLGYFVLDKLLVAKINHVSRETIDFVDVGRLHSDLRTNSFSLINSAGKDILRGEFGINSNLTNGRSCEHNSNASQCIEFEGIAKWSVLHRASIDIDCYSIEWSPFTDNISPEDCFNLNGNRWYGGAGLIHQYWPIEKASVPMQPYLSSGFIEFPDTKIATYGGFLERLWVGSKGIGILVDGSVPLHSSINSNNDGKLCLKAQYKNSLYAIGRTDPTPPVLRYTVCVGNNVKTIYNFLMEKHFKKPTGIPDERMFRSPVWSTWARYKTDVNQSKVLNFAHEIKSRGFSNSQLEIDDMWTPTYGDYEFTSEKFPDAKGMISALHSMGFRVTAWIAPFANLDSAAFQEGLSKKYLIQDDKKVVPALTRWWQGIGGIIDFTNPAACGWFISRLNKLRKKTGLDSYKLDAGELDFLPSSYSTYRKMNDPGEYTIDYVKCVAKLGGLVEVRAGYQTQEYAVFQRMFDKDSTWGYDNGLKTVIPTALVMGIIGYPFNLPDMIGGNAYDPDNFLKTVLPEKELFIRWMQLNAYLPAMQFSIPPWQYDEQVVNIALKMVQVHEDVVTPIVLRAAKEATRTGAPIIRPLWWIAPDDEVALTIDSEFLVGNDLLVAPILDKDRRSRDIYLPYGTWKDELRGRQQFGGQWLNNYKIELDEIATFIQVKI